MRMGAISNMLSGWLLLWKCWSRGCLMMVVRACPRHYWGSRLNQPFRPINPSRPWRKSTVNTTMQQKILSQGLLSSVFFTRGKTCLDLCWALATASQHCLVTELPRPPCGQPGHNSIWPSANWNTSLTTSTIFLAFKLPSYPGFLHIPRQDTLVDGFRWRLGSTQHMLTPAVARPHCSRQESHTRPLLSSIVLISPPATAAQWASKQTLQNHF